MIFYISLSLFVKNNITMRFLKLTSLSLVTLIFISCSDESTDTSPLLDNQQFTGDFFPLSIDNSWDYDVENTDNDNNQVVDSQDVLIVSSQSLTGFTLSVNQGGFANGIMSGILSSGQLTRTETTLAANGTIGLPIDGLDFEIELENALLYNTEAAIDAQLSEKSGVFTQTLQDFPITINYTLQSTQLENLSEYTANGTTYNEVTSANISLNLNVTTEVSFFGITQVVSIIDSQNILSVDSFYAKDIGLVFAEADSGYTLNTTTVSILQQAGITLDMLPTSLSVTNTQVLTDYSIN